MDFDVSAEQFLNDLPPHENRDWELKTGKYLDEGYDPNGFEKELGKQVSAFANSGGGVLIFGANDKTRAPELCTIRSVGNQSLRDWLSDKVEFSVSYPFQAFDIEVVKSATEPSKALYVVVIRDSQKTPYQAVKEERYYRRVDHKSKPAPHFYVDLLSNRPSKALVNIIGSVSHEGTYSINGDKLYFALQLSFEVENQSSVVATHWGLHVSELGDSSWTLALGTTPKSKGTVLAKVPSAPVLMPGAVSAMQLVIHGRKKIDPRVPNSIEIFPLLTKLRAVFHGVSHNQIGEPLEYVPCPSAKEVNEFMKNVQHPGTAAVIIQH